MIKSDLLKEIEDSKIKIKNYIFENKLWKDEISDLIFKIIESEPTEVQQIISLYYVDEFSIEEILDILGIEEIRVLQYFQLILFKVKLILNINSQEDNPYSTKKFWKSNNDKKWSLFDNKT